MNETNKVEKLQPLSEKCPPEFESIIRELESVNDRMVELAKRAATDGELKSRVVLWIDSLTWDNHEWP